MNRNFWRYIFALTVLLSWATSSQAVLFTTSGTNSSSGHSLAASASFTVSGSTLTIVLTNTSTQTYGSTNLQSNDVLTAIFWDVANSPTTLNYTNAATGAGSSLVQTSLSGTPTDLRASDSAGGIQGGWQFKGPSLPTSPDLNGTTQQYGLGTAGLGIFNGSNIQSSQSWGSNVDFGVVNTDFVAGQIQPGGLTSTPLVRNSIQFTFTNLPSNFSINDISNVRFQYGTTLADFNGIGSVIIPTPEPSTVLSSCLGAVVSLLYVRRRRRLTTASV